MYILVPCVLCWCVRGGRQQLEKNQKKIKSRGGWVAFSVAIVSHFAYMLSLYSGSYVAFREAIVC